MSSAQHKAEELSMPEFTDADARALERAHRRLDDVTESITKFGVILEYQERRLTELQAAIINHMDREEKEFEKMNDRFERMDGRLAAITKYKWIALGIIVATLLLTGNPELIVKVIGMFA